MSTGSTLESLVDRTHIFENFQFLIFNVIHGYVNL